MKRSQFLATIAALFAAPFTLKSKEATPSLPTAQDLIDLENSIAANYRTTVPLEEWQKANPILLNRKIKGEDLYIVLDKDRYNRRSG